MVSLRDLTHSDLLRILKEPKNSLIKQYQKLFSLDEVDLIFEESALDLVAKEALDQKNGARALKSILEKLLLDVMFEIPNSNDISKCVVKYDKENNRNIFDLISDEGTILRTDNTRKAA